MWVKFVYSENGQQDITKWGSTPLNFLCEEDEIIKKVLLGGGREKGRHGAATSTT